MKEVKVVIGKNFGDEGKGATVHRICKGKDAIVVRHNGGAQAGHTVEEGDFRFVFHQLGSGSLAGCPTFWSRTFLPDLLKLDEEVKGFVAEARKVVRLEQQPLIYAHPECACTVIYDVLLNSLTEVLRGSAKHGSCGMGIYEATLRTGEKAYTLQLKDFATGNVADIAGKMERIRQEYTFPRLQKLQKEYGDAFWKPEVSQWVELIEDDNVLWNVTEQMCENFRQYVKLISWQEVQLSYDTIVFENAQGLMLDRENEEYYPHLTPSYTGLHNVVEMLSQTLGDKSEEQVSREAFDALEERKGTESKGREESKERTESIGSTEDKSRTESKEKAEPYTLEVLYVTRTYVTRHGMGRLDYECPKEAINPHMIDKTNVPNFWQDTLRYAKHPSGEEFWKYIRKDLQYAERLNGPAKIIPYIYVNHLDETEGKILFADKEMDLVEFKIFCMESTDEKIQCKIYAD